MRLKVEMVDLLRDVQKCPQPKQMQSQLDALAEIDAFVMAHATLEAREFFRQLRCLDAWRVLSSFEEKEREDDGAAR